MTWRAWLIAAVAASRIAAADLAPVEPAPADMETIVERLGLETPEARLRVLIASGALAALFLGWVLWRTRPNAVPSGRVPGRARARFGPDGVPSLEEVVAWPQPRLRAVIAALAEADGYAVELLPSGGEHDLVLRRRGHPRIEVIVCCVPGAAGAVHGRRVGELDTAVGAAEAPAGWIVGAAGLRGRRACGGARGPGRARGRRDDRRAVARVAAAPAAAGARAHALGAISESAARASGRARAPPGRARGRAGRGARRW